MEVKTTNNPNEFLCQSQSNELIWYKVNIVSGECECPYWQKRMRYTNGNCKHYIEVMNKLQSSNIQIPKVEITNGMLAGDFVDEYGEETLVQLKRNFEVVERQGKLWKL